MKDENMSGIDLDRLFEQARALKERMDALQQDLARRTVTGQAGGGMVTVTANGRMDVVSVKLDPACVDPRDIGMLEDLVCAATNQALREARALVEREMGSLAGMSGLPGIGGMPGLP